MLITMLADRFTAGGVLAAKGSQITVDDDLAFRWIGDGVATDVGQAREALQGTLDPVSGAGNLGNRRSLMARCLTGRSSAVAVASTAFTGTGLVTGLTQHQRHALATAFDSVRIGIPNMHTAAVAGVKVIFGVSNTLGTYSAAPAANSSTGTTSASPAPTETVSSTGGVWRSATFGGQSSGTLAAAIDAANNYPSYTWTDWCQVASVDRTDGGTYPVLDLRIFIPVAGANISLGYTGASNTAYAAFGREDLITGGRVCRVWNQDVDGVTTPANFTTATTTPTVIPVILQFTSRTTGRTLMVVADSIGEASTGPTYLLNGFALKAALASSVPTEVCAQGFGGATSIQATNRAFGVIDEVRPSHILATAASVNNFGTTLGQRVVNEAMGTVGTLVSLAQRWNSRLGVYGFLPVTDAAKPYGATDSFRQTANATLPARVASYGATYIDLVGALQGQTVNSHIELATALDSGDGVHPGDPGHTTGSVPVGLWLANTP
ncbi:SGNH/GDSL hydrolase family protein [Pelomonas sp. Root1444]|uniref:SGNH/GDSL hydrolase family protein n=1 Tax=Pelomonas sp. Root1444 TaxID=1736464 RepID=UPI0007038327|nr:SGNH/GDSL hydrolase family protein [Pelomonas sp. Root1444]KQY83661.1 hypothetical protein ASD35_24360 [Pelomonas sp. Root1444]